MLPAAAILVAAISLAHSWLGERYILIRLFRQPLPKLFGSDTFTRKTLRFAWHITSVAWLGFAVLLLQLDSAPMSRSAVLVTISVTFAVTGAVALIASRGRHLSWIVFAAIAALVFIAA